MRPHINASDSLFQIQLTCSIPSSGLWEVIPLLDSLSCFSITFCLCRVDTANYAMYGIWLHTASLRKVLSYEKKVIYILHTGVWNTCQWWAFQLIRPCNFKLVHRPASLASNGRLGMRLLGLISILLNLKSCAFCQKHWAKVPDHLAWHTVSNSCSNCRR